MIVAPAADAVVVPADDAQAFAACQVIEAGPFRSMGEANARGVEAARAPIVALTEDHVFPDPDWADALLAAHRQPWAAVGPVVRNANPRGPFSWADLLIGYGPWIDPAPAGAVDHLPGHNSAYKRDVLLAYGPNLRRMMEAETVLHWDLRSKGHELYLEPAARIAHMNFARLAPFLTAHFYGGRMFAAARARDGGWRWHRRVLFAGGSPLIPFVRLRRIIRDMQRPGRPLRMLWRVLPHVLLGLSADAGGQMLGYVFGAGRTRTKLTKLEFHRYRFASAIGSNRDEYARP